MPVQVNITGNSLYSFRLWQLSEPFLETEHVAMAAFHGFYISVKLSLHFVADKLVYLIFLNRVAEVGVEVVLCNHNLKCFYS